METKLLVGLGNVGERFRHTRHNLGIMALRRWLPGSWRVEGNGEVAVVSQGVERVWGLFPLTMMNESGRAIVSFLKRHAVAHSHIWIIHDDLELPLGEVESGHGGSARGHNGVRSIIDAFGSTEFGRVRLGIGRPPEDIAVAEFVLQDFQPHEQILVETMLARSGQLLTDLTGVLPQNN